MPQQDENPGLIGSWDASPKQPSPKCCSIPKLPANPRDVEWHRWANVLSHRARAYQYQDGKIENAPLEGSSCKIPGAGPDTTAEDLMHFVATLMKGGILKPQTIATTWTPFMLRSGIEAGSGIEPNATYGLGWEIPISKGRKIVWHTGNLRGVSNVLAILPGERFAVAILTNMENSDPVDMANELLELSAGMTTAAPVKQDSP